MGISDKINFSRPETSDMDIGSTIDMRTLEKEEPVHFEPLNESKLKAGPNDDMMKRVRSTAKWHQLYKSGTTFPPKHKVLFIN